MVEEVLATMVMVDDALRNFMEIAKTDAARVVIMAESVIDVKETVMETVIVNRV